MSVTMGDISHSPIRGYPKLACYMGTYSESSIYRRFRNLNSQNLLYMQAEITSLERKLRDLEAADLASGDATRVKYSKDWFWLQQNVSGERCDQWKTVLDIRRKLADYNNTVVQLSTISRLENPSSHNLRSLQSWLERPNMGDCNLMGMDRNTWGDAGEPINPHHDLLAIFPTSKDDPFSTWLAHTFIRWIYQSFLYRFVKPDDLESGIASYEEETLQKYTSYITTIVASLLPILAIVALYYITTMKIRLAIVSLFTFVFASSLLIFTNSRRGEVFIATSAFAAVQVVFIATSN